MKRVVVAAAAALALMGSATANAAVIVYATPGGSNNGGEALSATATFTTSNGAVSLLLQNLIVDPNSVGQNISGISFTIATATSGSLSSSSGVPRTINAGGTFSDGAAAATDWIFSFAAGGNFALTGLGANGPDQTIVGLPHAVSGEYDNANGSIAANMPHNPFLALSGTFNISGLGITDQSVLTNVRMYFGTGDNPFFVDLDCREGCGPPPPSVPEPTSMLLLGSGLVGVAMRLRRKRQ